MSRQPVPGAVIEVTYLASDSLRAVTTADDAGRFSIIVPREGPARLTARRLGYRPYAQSFTIVGDTTRVAVLLAPVAQPLAPVVVDESAVEGYVKDLVSSYRPIDHAVIFDEAALKRSGQLHAGSFLLGRGGIRRVPCQRSQSFLPKGKMRTSPVEHEAADIFWPCVMRRSKPVSVLVSIDGGPAREFAQISSRELEEFAMVVVIQGQLVHAYTKAFVRQRTLARLLEKQ